MLRESSTREAYPGDNVQNAMHSTGAALGSSPYVEYRMRYEYVKDSSSSEYFYELFQVGTHQRKRKRSRIPSVRGVRRHTNDIGLSMLRRAPMVAPHGFMTADNVEFIDTVAYSFQNHSPSA